jgi:Arc/MetJ-type ribon-helix-helix transcriptional regulator
MAKPTTIRIPDDLLREVDELVRELNLDRSSYLREVLRKGFLLDRQDRLLERYARGDLSQMQVCHELNWNAWEFLNQLRARKLRLNVQLEDWMDASEIQAKPSSKSKHLCPAKKTSLSH